MTETAQYGANQTNPNDFLMGGGDGIPGAKFPEPGAFLEGPIVGGPRAYQEREYNSQTKQFGEGKKFPSGDPIMGVNIDVQTPYIDPMVEGDTGVRRLYIEGKLMKQAIREAVLAAGGKGLEVGGWIRLDFTHREDPMDKRSARHWKAVYRTAANQQLLGGAAAAPAIGPTGQAQPAYQAASAPAPAPQQAYQPPVQQALPVQQEAAAPVAQAQPAAAPAGDPVATAKALIASGQPDAVIAQVTGLDAVVIGAIRNM